MVTVLLLIKGYGVVSLVAAFVAVQYIGAICYFLFISRYITPLRCTLELRFAKQLLTEVKAFAGASMLAGVVSRPEVIFLSLIGNDAQLGFYSAGIKLVDLWGLIPQIYMTNVYPVLSRTIDDERKFQMIRDKSIKLLFTISLPITAVFLVAAPSIIRTIYGPGFEPATPILRALLLNIPMTSLLAVTWRVLAVRGEQGKVMRIQGVTSFVRVAAGYSLVYLFAGIGGALSVTGAYLIQNVLLLREVGRNGFGVPLVNLTWRLTFAAVVAGTVALLAHGAPLWKVIPLSASAYVISAVMLRAFSAEDFDLFRKALFRRTADASPPL
jgi:O-antigen/teichoic acid export membrane protein